MFETLINVADLLKGPVGAKRTIELSGELLGYDDGVLGFVSGVTTLTRTDSGIWASGLVGISVSDACSRCLKEIEYEVRVQLNDEYLPPVDVVSGARLRYDNNGDADLHSIDHRHHLNLTATLQEYRRAALPLAPVCADECRGICPRCGADLNVSTHDCEIDIDPRWDKLRELMG